jgi:DNA-binding SARP family transcriptional activator
MNRPVSTSIGSASLLKGPNRLRILVLGTPEIIVSRIPIYLNHQKAQALLYYLAATGRQFTREHLAALLWTEASESGALHSLRSSLYHLRQGLRSSGIESVLFSEGDWLGLQSGFYECDLSEFSQLAAANDQSALVKAVSLYRGPLLQGFSMSDASAFDGWLQGEETHQARVFMEALSRLAGWAEERQEWPAAIDTLQRLWEIDPLDDAVVQRLMRACLNQGEIGLALRHYRRFEALLRQQLSLEPSADTRTLLYDALRQQRSSISTPVAAALAAPSGPVLLPLTGRERLLDQLIDISRSIQTGRGSTVLIEGEAGIGKTRLIDEFTSRLLVGQAPWRLLQGACSPFDELLSYGPFLEAFATASAGEPTDLPVELDPSLPDTRGRFSWRVLQTIRSLTHNLPLLLIIEDLQWANSSSLNLFGFLSMRLQRLPVLLVGSVQHADSIPALQRLVALGRRHGDLHLLPLTPLNQDGIISILRASSVEPASMELLAEWLYMRSTGSPFLLTEILAQLRKEGLLQVFQDGWRLDISRWWQWRRTFELPETTHDLVAWRLADLSQESRHLLDVLAVAGQPLGAAVLSSMPGFTFDHFNSLLADLSGRRLLMEMPGGRLTLPHHLLRETLLHRLSSLQQRAIHRQLAEALEAHMSWNETAALHQFALHAVAGEDIGRARRYGLTVLPELPQAYMGADTLEFVHHLHDLLAPSASPAEMVLLTHSLGSLHLSLGHLETALQWLAKCLEWARKVRDPLAQAEAHFQISEVALAAVDYRKAMGSARQGLAVIDMASSDPSAPKRLSMLVGRGQRLLGAAFAMEGRDLAAAGKHLHEAVTALRQGGNLGDLCAGLFELGNIAAQRGELQAALTFYDESARTAEAGNSHYYLALARNNYAYHSLLLGQVDQAEKVAVQGVKAAETHDLLAALLHLYSTRGEIHLYLAEWDKADESFHRGLAIAEDLGSLERKAGYHAGQALTARGRGDLTKAASLLEEALAMISEAGYWHLRTRLQLWLAETFFALGRFNESEGVLQVALQIAREHRRTLLLVQGERLQAGLLARSGDWVAAEQLFIHTFKAASGLELDLEKARVQAAWGNAALLFPSQRESALNHIKEARSTFQACRALSDLAGLPSI